MAMEVVESKGLGMERVRVRVIKRREGWRLRMIRSHKRDQATSAMVE